MPHTIKDAWCEQFSRNQNFRASDRQLKPFGNQKKECDGWTTRYFKNCYGSQVIQLTDADGTDDHT